MHQIAFASFFIGKYDYYYHSPHLDDFFSFSTSSCSSSLVTLSPTFGLRLIDLVGLLRVLFIASCSRRMMMIIITFCNENGNENQINIQLMQNKHLNDTEKVEKREN